MLRKTYGKKACFDEKSDDLLNKPKNREQASKKHVKRCGQFSGIKDPNKLPES